MKTRTRMDMHCHSMASRGAAVAWLEPFGIPESYSPPERVYEQAKVRGMDLVTLTDHDTIDGAIELLERGFEGVVVGEEVSVCFPEDGCQLHVLVWGHSPAQHEQIGALGLRGDVYEFAGWLKAQGLAHALAHPVYAQNDRLTPWHLERCTLLFRAWECLNGAHAGRLNEAATGLLDGLSARRVRELESAHGIACGWPRAWDKPRTGGSDDHGLLNVGTTYTEVAHPPRIVPLDGSNFLKRVMGGHGLVGGESGSSERLAHQFLSVGIHHAAARLGPVVGAGARAAIGVAARLVGAGSLDAIADACGAGAGGEGGVTALPPLLGEIVNRLPTLIERHPVIGAALADEFGFPALSHHAEFTAFADELTRALSEWCLVGAVGAWKAGDRATLLDRFIDLGAIGFVQLPALYALFHQNKERALLDTLGARTGPPRVALFTDTLDEVNGVSRFIVDVATRARETGHDLRVITCGDGKNDHGLGDRVSHFSPLFRGPMPGYAGLELRVPPVLEVLRYLDRHPVDVVHVSTPGPMGAAGVLAARMLRVPVVATHHTDFGAYGRLLLGKEGLVEVGERALGWLYRTQCQRVLTRSRGSVEQLVSMGVGRDRVEALRVGVDTAVFRPRGSRAGRRSDGVLTALFAGRLSAEKNTGFLADVWERVWARCGSQGVRARLVIAGDGPDRATLEKRLGGIGAEFTGFLPTEALAALYSASDVLVFPSVTETLGQVVTEAQACGLPAMVSDRGGPCEVVRHGTTGLVLPASEPADVECWAAALFRLMTDAEMRALMGGAAAESMRAHSIGASCDHFLRVHHETCDAWRADHRVRREAKNARSMAADSAASTPEIGVTR